MSFMAAALFAAMSSAALAQNPAAPAAAAASVPSYDARLTAVTGEVTVFAADAPTQPAAASVGMPLDEGDRVVVAAGGSAEVSLDGASLLQLGENADFTLTSLSRARAELSLALGSLLAKIQKLGVDRLEVRTPAAVAAVRGTEFGVDAGGAGGEARVGVFDEGRVEVSGSGAMETLTPNQETSVRPGERPRPAGPLSGRFLARRAAMRAAVRRLAVVRRGWRRVSAARRREFRRRAFARQRRAYQMRRRAVPRSGRRRMNRNERRRRDPRRKEGR